MHLLHRTSVRFTEKLHVLVIEKLRTHNYLIIGYHLGNYLQLGKRQLFVGTAGSAAGVASLPGSRSRLIRRNWIGSEAPPVIHKLHCAIFRLFPIVDLLEHYFCTSLPRLFCVFSTKPSIT